MRQARSYAGGENTENDVKVDPKQRPRDLPERPKTSSRARSIGSCLTRTQISDLGKNSPTDFAGISQKVSTKSGYTGGAPVRGLRASSAKSSTAPRNHLDRINGEAYGQFTRSSQLKITSYMNNGGEMTADVKPCRVQSNESITLYGKVRALMLAKRQNTGITQSAFTRPCLASRPRSSGSRLSKLSQRSVVRQSSDGMDNTDMSSEADHDKDPACPASNTVHRVTPHRHMDTDTLERIHRWMNTLPPKFSGLCSVISIPDTTPGFDD